MASLLPDLSLFIYTYVRKEAVLSSQIEGTQSSLSDLLLFKSLGHMQELGILREVTGRERHRLFVYEDYLEILNEGTEPIR